MNYITKIKKFMQKIILLSSLSLVLGCTKVVEHSHAKMGQQIHVHGAWIRAVPAVSHISAVYLNLINHGDHEDQLLSVKTKLAEVAEMHNVKRIDGMMSMFRVPSISVPAGGEQNLKPGSYHIMLVNLNQTPKMGEEYELLLYFKHAGIVKVIVPVREGQPMKKEMNHGSMSIDSVEPQ